MAQGKIIFLNGTSSAGKTTLAHGLQEIMPEPYLHIALDQFRDGMPARFRGLNSPIGTDGERGLNVVPRQSAPVPITEIRFGETGRRMLRGMRRSIAAMAAEGNNVIIDDIILEPEFLDDYLEVLAHLDVYFVGVRCPAAVIAARESERPGRFPGTAAGHSDICHAHRLYDVEVDTSILDPNDCAQLVAKFVKAQAPHAFSTLIQSRFNPDNAGLNQAE